MTPLDTLTALRSSDAALLAALDAEVWAEHEVRAPSRLPGWTRGHVLTHLARNADAIGRTVAGALRGDIVPKYPEGPAGRAADIEAGAGRRYVDQRADLREAIGRLDAVFAELSTVDAWDRPTEDRPAGAYVLGRWREVEIHRVDIGGAYSARNWPPAFVAAALPELLAGLPARLGAEVAQVRFTDATAVVGGGVFDEVGGVGEGAANDPIVTGLGWAVLAWLLGRTDPDVLEALGSPPELGPWL
jgi:maleylpyruvate isomerase